MYNYIYLNDNFIVDKTVSCSVEYSEEFIKTNGCIECDAEDPMRCYFVDGQLGPHPDPGYFWEYDAENKTHQQKPYPTED